MHRTFTHHPRFTLFLFPTNRRVTVSNVRSPPPPPPSLYLCSTDPVILFLVAKQSRVNTLKTEQSLCTSTSAPPASRNPFNFLLSFFLVFLCVFLSQSKSWRIRCIVFHYSAYENKLSHLKMLGKIYPHAEKNLTFVVLKFDTLSSLRK